MTLPSWVRGTVLLAVTFVAGVVGGVGYERHRVPAYEATGKDGHHLTDHLRQELGLDPAQQRAIDAILARHQGAVDSTWRMVGPRVHATMDSTLREILGVLRPDQAAKFRRMVDAMHPGALK